RDLAAYRLDRDDQVPRLGGLGLDQASPRYLPSGGPRSRPARHVQPAAPPDALGDHRHVDLPDALPGAELGGVDLHREARPVVAGGGLTARGGDVRAPDPFHRAVEDLAGPADLDLDLAVVALGRVQPRDVGVPRHPQPPPAPADLVDAGRQLQLAAELVQVIGKTRIAEVGVVPVPPVRTVGAPDGAVAFRAALGEGDDLDELAGEPLPHGVELQPVQRGQIGAEVRGDPV